eukprot:TRINITY_DN9671_c0_g1_i2.p1 TRINITY_DN9671_c0_g1~~TRINITY_DN9671_c0_g1_i2.p1  ORF type:complete len:215 (-),score=10.15 TRINITY_DN9671_c0_g1_i2:135-779(-)
MFKSYEIESQITEDNSPIVAQMASLKSLSDEDIKKLNKWLRFSKRGKLIPGTNIIPMKIFLLKERWLPHLSEDEFHCPKKLMLDLQAQKLQPKVIVDLSSSLDYYEFNSLKELHPDLYEGLEYIKYPLVSGELPTKESCEDLYNILKRHADQDYHVILHCVNGINRTGIIACYFLYRYLNITLKEAYEVFCQARGHTFCHEEFTEALEHFETLH